MNIEVKMNGSEVLALITKLSVRTADYIYIGEKGIVVEIEEED